MADLSAAVVRSQTPHPLHGIYTNFPIVESPLSENGLWSNGNGAAGRTNINTTSPGKVWSPRNFLTGVFDDGFLGLTCTGGPTLALQPWPADQFVEFNVRSTNPLSDPNFCEIGCELRTTVFAGNQLSGYEINWRVNHDGTQYHEIVYWYGPTGINGVCADGCSFHAIVHMINTDGFIGIFDGDTLGASIVGNRIRTWQIHNGVKQILQDIRDTGGADGGALFKTGNPGISHWHHGDGGDPSDFWHTWVKMGRAAS